MLRDAGGGDALQTGEQRRGQKAQRAIKQRSLRLMLLQSQSKAKQSNKTTSKNLHSLAWGGTGHARTNKWSVCPETPKQALDNGKTSTQEAAWSNLMHHRLHANALLCFFVPVLSSLHHPQSHSDGGDLREEHAPGLQVCVRVCVCASKPPNTSEPLCWGQLLRPLPGCMDSTSKATRPCTAPHSICFPCVLPALQLRPASSRSAALCSLTGSVDCATTLLGTSQQRHLPSSHG
jgi:hypothetical protein